MAPLDVEYLTPTTSVLEDLAWHAESLCLLILDAEGRLIRANAAAHSCLGPLATGQAIWKLLPLSSDTLLRERMQEARTAPVRGIQLNFSNRRSYALTLSCSIGWSGESCIVLGEALVERDQRMKQELLDLTRELSESNRDRARVAGELTRTLTELQNSHWHIRRIQEFLTACCMCNRIRMTPDEDGAVWKSLSLFLAENGLLMSHGYCPECEAKAFPE